MAIVLASKPGLSSTTTLNIPKTWDPVWFRNFISNQLKGADVRNSISGNGISVTGTIASPYATISIGGSGPVTLPGPVTISGGGLIVGAPTGGNEGAGTVNATNYYLNGVLVLQTGTFTGTLTGCTTAPTATFHYAIAGNVCVVSLANPANLTATSNTDTLTITGLPAVCQPATQQPIISCVVADNGLLVQGAALVQQSGTITFFRASLVSAAAGAAISYASNTFMTSGTKGMDSTILTYSLQ